MFPNALNRLRQVNKTSPPGVVDLHFQAAGEVVRVLEAVLRSTPGGDANGEPRVLEWSYYEGSAAPRHPATGLPLPCVWIVTGAGRHSAPNAKTLIFDVVLEHLMSTGRKFRVGKSTPSSSTGEFGSFLVEF